MTLVIELLVSFIEFLFSHQYTVLNSATIKYFFRPKIYRNDVLGGELRGGVTEEIIIHVISPNTHNDL